MSDRPTRDETAERSSLAETSPSGPRPVANEIPELDPRYELLDRLGQGGMATVWRAHDRVLGRDVALKQLKAGAEVQGRMRFLREAQVAAQLQHANIVQVFDFRARDDGGYLAMELVEGQTLRALLDARGRLPWLLAAMLCHEVARALEYAHARGVTHRDVKPENVLLSSDGAVKLSDFGIAAIATGTRLTAPDAILGTPLYLAPERIRGEEPDARADVFSLGVTLYELLAGVTPWRSGPPAAVLHAILFAEPARIETVGVEVEPALAQLINRCIAQDARLRPRDAGIVAAELSELIRARVSGDTREVLRSSLQEAEGAPKLDRVVVPDARVRKRVPMGAWVAVGFAAVGAIASVGWLLAPAHHEPTLVAVADFENASGDPELDALSGLMVTSLEQSRALTVLTRARELDALRAAGKGDVTNIDEALGREVCRQSGARALIVGSVRKLGGVLLVDVKVVDPARTDYVFATSVKVARKEDIPATLDALSGTLRDRLDERAADVGASKVQLAQATTANLAAYRHYFEGEHRLARLEAGPALAEFRAASEADPSFALAFYRIAYVLKWQGQPGAAEALERAYAAREGLPEKERLMVTALHFELAGDGARAAEGYRQVVARYPNEKEALFAIGDLAAHAQRLEEALMYLKRALALDPGYAPALQHMVLVLDMKGAAGEALEYAQRYFKRDATADARIVLADAHGAMGQYDEARAVLEQARETADDPAAIELELAQVDVAERKWDAAQRHWEQAVQLTREPSSVGGSGVSAIEVGAWSALYRGETERALRDVQGVERAAWMLIGRGDEQGAAAVVDAVWPEHASLGLRRTYHLAVVLWRLGRLEQSRVLVEGPLKTFASAKEIQKAHEARAAGRWAECEAVLAEVPWRNTSAIRLIHAQELADCQRRAGHDDAARKTLERALAVYPGVNETKYGLRPVIFRQLEASRLQR